MNWKRKEKQRNFKQTLRKIWPRKSEKSSLLNKRRNWRENSKTSIKQEMTLLSRKNKPQSSKRKMKPTWKIKWTNSSKTQSLTEKLKRMKDKLSTISLNALMLDKYSKLMRSLWIWCSNSMLVRIRRMTTQTLIWNTSTRCFHSRSLWGGVTNNQSLQTSSALKTWYIFTRILSEKMRILQRNH